MYVRRKLTPVGDCSLVNNKESSGRVPASCSRIFFGKIHNSYWKLSLWNSDYIQEFIYYYANTSHQIVICRRWTCFIRYAVVCNPRQHNTISVVQHAHCFGVKAPRLTTIHGAILRSTLSPADEQRLTYCALVHKHAINEQGSILMDALHTHHSRILLTKQWTKQHGMHSNSINLPDPSEFTLFSIYSIFIYLKRTIKI